MAYRRPFPDNTIPTGGVFADSTPPRTTGHRGTDWSAFKGAHGAIPAVTTSTFSNAGWSSVVGWWVELLGSDGVYSTYCHMAAKSPLAGYKQGQAVSAGTRVGDVGATGTAARGAHLHLAMSRIRGGGLSASLSKLIDPHAHIIANLAPATAGGKGTTLTPQREASMFQARHPSGAIIAVGELTYRNLNLDKYNNNIPAYGPFIQYTDEGYRQLIIDVEESRAYAAAAVNNRPAAEVDTTAIAAKVAANIASDLARLSTQIAEINTVLGPPVDVTALADAIVDEQAARLQY